MKLRPVGDSFLLVPDDVKTMTDGGLHIPDSAQEKQRFGTVIAVGEGRYNHLLGTYIGMPVKEGDKILYKPYAGLDIELCGETAIILKSEDILAVCEESEHEEQPESEQDAELASV